ncbi:MAG: hypothetical protein JWN85_3676 [Gammaproteobacteria bacterium]|nr:hypothetical protein [Gammaproteobacteria bacterium]
MKRNPTALKSPVLLIASICLAGGAFAQTQPTPPPTPSPSAPADASTASRPNTPDASRKSSQPKSSVAQSPDTASRPDAVYPKRSGHDAKTDKAPPQTRQPGNNPSASVGTEPPNVRAVNETPPVRKLARQKTYKGNTGKKVDPGTACSTARPTPNGGLDCGMSGTSATPRGLNTHRSP